MNKPPDKQEHDAVRGVTGETRPTHRSFMSRWRRRLASTRLNTWIFVAWVLISMALYYPGELLSKAISSVTPSMAGALVLMVAAVPASYAGRWMEQHFANWLFRHVRGRCRQVDELVSAAREMDNTERMLQHVVQWLDEIFGVKGTAIYWANHDGFERVASTDSRAPLRLETDEILSRLERQRVAQRGEWSPLSRLGARVAWPIEVGKRLAGLLVVWEKEGSTAFQEDQEVERVQPLCGVLAHALSRGDVFKDKADFFEKCAKQYSAGIAGWFAEKFGVLQHFAAHDALQTNTVAKMRRVLQDVRKELGPAFNGVYVLNEKGLVIEHEAPPGVDIRGRFDASERDYFKSCMSEMGPVVCDSFESADRKVEILVVAVPRAGKRSSFIGILDAVIDVPRAPFSRMATETVQASPLLEQPRIAGVRLLLMDSAAIVLGSSDSQQRRRRASMDASPEVRQLRAGLGMGKTFKCDTGAIVEVAGTPFIAVAYESNDAQAWQR